MALLEAGLGETDQIISTPDFSVPELFTENPDPQTNLEKDPTFNPDLLTIFLKSARAAGQRRTLPGFPPTPTAPQLSSKQTASRAIGQECEKHLRWQGRHDGNEKRSPAPSLGTAKCSCKVKRSC